jgi:hypothetical protein
MAEQSWVNGHRPRQATVQNIPRNQDKASAWGRNCETCLWSSSKVLTLDRKLSLVGSLAEGILVMAITQSRISQPSENESSVNISAPFNDVVEGKECGINILLQYGLALYFSPKHADMRY